MDGLEGHYRLASYHEKNSVSLKPMSEEDFRRRHSFEAPSNKSLLERLEENAKCHKITPGSFFPILNWLRTYKKSDLISDVIAGFTVGIMHIPQGMAYALLGGVPPVIGIYMAFFPVLVYIIMGTSHHVSMGTFAVICMMTGKSVDQYARPPHAEPDSTLAGEGDTSALSPVEVATALCFIVGVWQVLFSLLRLGTLSVFLSPTLVSGFTTGAAVHVLTSQVRNIFGIKVGRYSGPFKIIYTYRDVFTNLKNLNVVSTVISISFIALLVLFNEFVKPLLQKRFKKIILIPVPIELLVVVAGTLLSIYLDVKNTYGVDILEWVPKGLPDPSVPPLKFVPKLAADGFVVAVVAMSINISMASIFAQKMGYEINSNQEMLASGLGNVFSSFFSCMPFAASLSRSLVQASVGGKTQITSAVSALFLLLILLFVGPFFEPLPYCVLSTIIVVALKGMFAQTMDLPSICRKSKLDGFVWIVTFFSVVVLDISYGLGIGLLASVFSLVLQSRQFHIVILGYVPDAKTYADIKFYKRARHVSGVLVVRIVGALHFANINSARKKILKEFVRFKKGAPTFVAPDATDEDKKKNLSLVLDLSCVPFADPCAAKGLLSVREELEALQCRLFMSGCHTLLYADFEKFKFFDHFSKSVIFHDLDDAVEHAKPAAASATKHDEIIVKF